MVQMDPISVVARTEHLVLWSRLGKRFRVPDLERMLWTDRSLFEYWVHIVPIEDFGIHRESMRRFPAGPREGRSRNVYLQEWLRGNASFRRYVLGELRTRGPLRSRDLEDRAAVPWKTGGWNDTPQRHVAMMLDVLWFRGEVMIVGRDGQQRIWDLAERTLPVDEPRLPEAEVARRILEGQLRAWGVARPTQFGFAFDGRPPGWERALKELEREGVAVPVEIEGLAGTWYAHGQLLEFPFRPRTVLLSPFDDLISDRDHAEALFGYRFRIEIYVPKAKREYGYYVLSILHGDRLIGRIDPRMDRRTGVFHVQAVHAEPEAGAASGPAVARAIGELADWLGATDVAFPRDVPAIWRRALRG